MSSEQESKGLRIENLLDTSSLEGQQTGHELGVHSGEVCLRDVCCGAERRLLQLSSESQGECLGQRSQLNLWKASHPLD